MISRMKIPPFIATLGMLYVTKGLSLVISELKPIYFNDTPLFEKWLWARFWVRLFPGSKCLMLF